MSLKSALAKALMSLAEKVQVCFWITMQKDLKHISNKVLLTKVLMLAAQTLSPTAIALK